MFSRRRFLQSLSAGALAPFQSLAAPERGRVKITDIKVMMLQGPRTYTLIKVITDSGVYGIGEGYGSPGVGVKEGVLEMRYQDLTRSAVGSGDRRDLNLPVFVNLGQVARRSVDRLVVRADVIHHPLHTHIACRLSFRKPDQDVVCRFLH